MMMLSIFRDNLFDNFMESFAFPVLQNVDKTLYGKHAKNMMKAVEEKKHYISIEE